MSITTQLLNQLDGPKADGAILSAAADGDRLTARVDQVSTLAATLWELRLTTDRLSGASISRVQQTAERITEQVTYLLEPIQPIESDFESCVVQMRSTKPDQTSDGISYYEVLVKTGGSISLHRYEKPKAALRREAPMTLTKEVIGRLAEDFLASVSR